MKKRRMKKLSLSKASVANFDANAVRGGNADNSDVYCVSVNFCETKDFSRCFGEAECQIYNDGRS